jgi:glycosyltransferase involved in cell wall biosynthesis
MPRPSRALSRGPVRVTIAARLFPPEPGAAAFRLGALAGMLADQSARVLVVTTGPPPSTRRLHWQYPGVALSRWPVLRDEGGNVRGYLQFASFDGPLFFRLVFGRRSDVVVVEPPPTTGLSVRLACAIRRTPDVYYAGDVSSTAAAGIGVSPRVVSVLRRVERWAMRGAARVLAVSEGVAEEVARLTGMPERVTVVGTGIDTDIFRPQPVPEEPAPTLLYAGTMSELHGAEIFVRAFGEVATEHPRAKLVMYGQGTEVPTMKVLAAQVAPGQVEIPGTVGGPAVAAALSSARAGLASLHPAKGYDYAFPTKMFAATACGAPVIYAGPGPGNAMVAEHRLGWACRWGVSEVAQAMRDALAHPWPPAERARLVAWTEEHASQHAAAAAASCAILAVAQDSARV